MARVGFRDLRRKRRGAAWAPPQTANLLGAWVQGLTGNVAGGGAWASSYGVSQDITVSAGASVGDSGLTGKASASITVGTPYNFSMAGWLYRTNDLGLMSWHKSGAPGNPQAYCRANATPSWYTANAYSIGTIIAADEWHHIAITFDGSTFDAYLDGSADGTVNKTYNSLHPLQEVFLMSGFAGDLTGFGDCFYLYETALTASEIGELYNDDPHRRGNL